MANVLTGFGIILAVVAAGYLIGRSNLLGPTGATVLSKLAFSVFTPCLLVTVLADADVTTLFSSALLTSAIAAVACAIVFAAIATLAFRRGLAEVVVGALSASYVNGGYLGLALAVYVLGDAAYSAPVVLLQVLCIAPIALTILDIATTGRASMGRIALQPFKNPIVIASLIGVLIAVTNLSIPTAVLEPFRLVGAAAVPAVLIRFGISLHGERVLKPGAHRQDVILATGIKLLVMPLVACGVGTLLNLDPPVLRAVVVMAALPVAQNVLNYAQQYNQSTILARDAIFLTTLGSIPILILASTLLA